MGHNMHAVFLDRDGVICENRSDHVKSWDEFNFLPGAKESIAALSRLNIPIVVVTNQAAINRGLTTAAAVIDIHTRMVAEINAAGGRVDRVLYCPHRPAEACDCRKPRAGMLRRAAADLRLDLRRSYMVGDALTDLQAGLAVGATPVMVLTGRGFRQLLPSLRALEDEFFVARSIVGAAAHIIKTEIAPVLPQFVSRPMPLHG